MEMRLQSLLVATDFSNAAIKAGEFAVEIAKQTGAKITFLHTFELQAWESAPDMKLYRDQYDETKQQAEQKMKAIIRSSASQRDYLRRPLEIQTLVIETDPVHEIETFAKEHPVDLVILGSSGKEDILRWYASTPGELLKHKNVTSPILVVPENASFHTFKRIVFAFKNVEDYKAVSDSFLPFCLQFQAETVLFHSGKEQIEADRKVLKEELEKDVHLTYSHSENENLLEALEEFTKNKKTDLIVLVHHKHLNWASLFHENIIKKLVESSNVLPLLILHAI
jgi:nucleotide-binding universal stress UspA family protein